MKNTIFLFLCFIGLTFSLSAQYSDTFLLGANTHCDINPTLLQLLQNAYYNDMEMTNWNDGTFPNELSTLNSYGFDVDVFDRRSNTVVNTIEYLTESNYYRFEEEYGAVNTAVNTGTGSDPLDLSATSDLNSDLFFYRFDKDLAVGGIDSTNTNASNGAAWYCPYNTGNNGTWKVISGDMYWRWFYNEPFTQVDDKLCYHFKFWRYPDTTYLQNNRLYISIALRWDYDPILDASIANDPIISTDFTGITPGGLPVDNINFRPEGSYGKTLKVSDISNIELAHDPFNYNNGFRVFTYSLNLDSLDTTYHLLVSQYALYYLVPKISWKQNRTVYLDYIEYEDDVHKAIMNDTSLDSWLGSRMTYYGNLSETNLRSYLALNEAYIGNSSSCKRVNDYLTSHNNLGSHPLVSNYVPDPGNKFERKKANPDHFSYTKVFNYYADPTVQCFHIYPLHQPDQDIDPGSVINFNNPANYYFIQNILDNMLESYKFAKEQQLPFYPVIQTYGQWKPYETPQHWTTIYPDTTTQKCLQYLPLCYGPSGIHNYIARVEGPEQIGLIESNYPYTIKRNYNIIKRANAKIMGNGNMGYGYIVKNATWKGTECIKAGLGLSQDFTLGLEHFTSMNMAGPFDSEPYHGYIQCGFFNNGSENYYMLVNRRTAKFISSTHSSPEETPYQDYDTAYQDMGAQTVELSVLNNGSMISEYGPHPGLYDPYTKDIKLFQNGHALIPIDAGEATLRQIVAVLPTSVSDSLAINRDFYAIQDVNIHHGGSVTIHSNKTLKMLPKTKIYVQNNARLHIYGTLIAGDSTQIIVESGSTLDLTNAVCKWGLGAGIVADSSNILISNTTLGELDSPNTWNGISCTDCTVSFTNHSIIENADIALDLSNSTLNLVSGSILVPVNGTGIKITGGNTNKTIRISGNDTDSTLIYSVGTVNPREEQGIDYNLSSNHLVVDHTIFRNLYYGIAYISHVAHADSILWSTFEGCLYGMEIDGDHGLNTIANCRFSSNRFGINTSYHQPDINNCTFIGGDNSFPQFSEYGIYLEFVIGNEHTGRIGDINGCSFENMTYGILCRESSSRICTSNFTNNVYGILNVGTCFINCSSSARNVFTSTSSNIAFSFVTLTSYFTTYMLLKWGHNQFYQPLNGYDFWFSSHFLYPGDEELNADGNYWEDYEITTNTFAGNMYIVDHHMDPPPPTLNYPVYEPDRYDNAAALEDSCQYEYASYAFRDILSDRFEEEFFYWGSCVDRSLKNAYFGEMDLDELISFYDAQINLTPDSLKNLKLLIRDYQAKTYILLEDYQSAADLIELVLEDPESEVDSLNAVLNLEICYLLASLQESKKPLITNFAQYRYPDLQTYTIKHREHLMQLLALCNQTNQALPVPNVVSMKQNYPNPFNPSTTIEFGIPKATKVSLRIYNIRGQLVKELINQRYEPGKYKTVWEGKNQLGKHVASGVYFYRLEAAGKCITHKMLMLK
jgi:hypothetical protein